MNQRNDGQGHRAATTESDPRWAAVVARDVAANGRFVYSVESTGVYCRPSCAARLARPENVRFHASGTDAQRAGFRPCKRCKPDEPPLEQMQAALVARACRSIEHALEEPRLEALAAAAGLSRFHFHRVFRAATGLTPKQYAASQRRQAIQQQLARAGGTVTDAIYAAGYRSSGRFYAEAEEVLGMQPKAFRAGGERAEIRFALAECSLGTVLVARSTRGICAILLGDEPEALLRDLQDRFPRAALVGGEESYDQHVADVLALVEAPQNSTLLPLDIQGTAFQQRVWQALQAVPAGVTVSYADIAMSIGAPRAVRAVASAIAANPLAVAIPCHRVVRSNGHLSGYRWGVERKRALLLREAASAKRDRL